MLVKQTTGETFPGFFWGEDSRWREAHQTLDLLFARYDGELARVRTLARRAEEGLNVLFPMFDRFGEQVCPECTTVCCYEARVAFDFRDLLFIHALGLDPPPHQLRRNDQEHCRYLSRAGCRLARISRPFVCTWYYCAPMLELFYRMPSRTQRRMSAVMSGVQLDRKKMEKEFIDLLISGPV